MIEVDEFMWNLDTDGNENIAYGEFRTGLSRMGISRDTRKLNSLVYTLEKEQLAQAANPLMHKTPQFQLRTTEWNSPKDDGTAIVECMLEVHDVTSTARNGLRCTSHVLVKAIFGNDRSATLMMTVDNVKAICSLQDSSTDQALRASQSHRCLLYTSDAADE